MNIDCQWIEKNMEALFCDTLAEQENKWARAHIESCAKCRHEVDALNAVDPLVKQHFKQQMSVAQARVPRRLRWSLVYGAGASAVAAALVLTVTMGGPEVNVTVVPPPELSQSQSASPAPVRTPADATRSSQPQVERAKPEAAPPAADSVRNAASGALDGNAPDFSVIDSAGYARTLEDYRGFVVVIGTWDSDQTESAANLEVLYKEFASETRLRFIGVALDRRRIPNTTFPLFYNQRSRLLDAKPGDFVLIDERGSIVLRGSLVSDFERISRQLRELR